MLNIAKQSKKVVINRKRIVVPVRIKHEERVKYVDVSVTVEALMQTAE